MSDEIKADYSLEDGIGSLQDGADGLFGKLPSYDALNPGQRSAAAEALRDVVIDQPLFAVTVAGLAGLIIGIFLRRRA
ncbi:hypothetical protein ACQ5TV_01710 [Acetobacter ghanensis]|uniref:hypothetical protein n=1 Tax=Acetobacter ghanensis TaxID=431306 RepID=UPI003D341F90